LSKYDISMDSRKISIVTTFSKKGYNLYGKRMIGSFESHWPKGINLYAYYEKDMPNQNSSRITYINLHEACPELVDFKRRHKENLPANGHKKGEYNYRWDAVKFSNKVFCIYHAAQTIDSDILVWIDADTQTSGWVSYKFLYRMLPPKKYCSYIGRKNRHSECGFMMFNLKHKKNKEFMEKYRDCYLNDKVFKQKQWHDSWIFDVIRKKVDDGKSFHDLTPGVKYLNFDKLMAKRMVHFKGSASKKKLK